LINQQLEQVEHTHFYGGVHLINQQLEHTHSHGGVMVEATR
jgi:hypothetical protein